MRRDRFAWDVGKRRGEKTSRLLHMKLADVKSAADVAREDRSHQMLQSALFSPGSVASGDHAWACTRTGLLARRAKIVELAWVRVAREAAPNRG